MNIINQQLTENLLSTFDKELMSILQNDLNKIKTAGNK